MTEMSAIYKALPWWAKLVGVVVRKEAYYMFTWGELGWRERFGLAVELCHFPEPLGYAIHLHLISFKILIHLPWPWPSDPPGDALYDSWGFVWHEREVHLHWDHIAKVVRLPWYWMYMERCDDGAPEVATFIYYPRHGGEPQVREATLEPEVRMWVWLISRRLGLKWPKLEQRYINVAFNKAVGERVTEDGSGVMGCSYLMKPKETPRAALRRMEREEEF